MKRKLITIFLLLVLLPTLGLGYCYYLQTTTSAYRNMNQATLQTLVQVQNNIEYTLQIVNQTSDSLFFSKVVKDFIGSENNKDLILQLTQLKELRNLLYNMELQKRRIYTVRLFVDGDKMASTERVNIFSVESIEEEDWYQETVKQAGAIVWSGAYLETEIAGEPNLWLISCRRILKHSESFYDNDGILSMDIEERTLYSFLGDINLRKSENVFIVDSNGYMISGADKSKLGQPVLEKSLLEQVYTKDRGILELGEGDKKEYVVFTTVENTGWKIVERIEAKYILENYTFWGDMYFVLSSIALLMMFVAASFVIINNITKEIMERMQRIAKKIEIEGIPHEGESNHKAFMGNDDLQKVENQVYKMIQYSNELAEESYKAHREERKAQLMALQAQINPHFLYNTLECINWMALRRNAPDISYTITTLAKYFRLTLNKGKTIVGIEDELELAKTYLTIQNLRFDNALEVNINRSAEITQYTIPKLTLQPIIENAVIHGIMKKQEKRGKIVVDASILEDEIQIIVEDDGVGMDQEKVNQLLEQQLTDHYGIYNVQERIQLYYGEHYGISIVSNLDEGTKVTIRIGKMYTVPHSVTDKGEI